MPIKTQNYIHDYFNKNKGNYDRSEKFNYELKKGQQWFSITNYCVKYILSNKNLIREMFKYSACPDEHFIQTLIYNSKFKNNISYDTCLREIDWNRGCPYVFKLEDYDFLMKSENLFARKFDSNQDRNIINKIYQAISTNII